MLEGLQLISIGPQTSRSCIEALGRVDADGTLLRPDYVDMVHTGPGEDGTEIFTTTTPLPRAGAVGYTVRVLPHHPLLAGDSELGLVALA